MKLLQIKYWNTIRVNGPRADWYPYALADSRLDLIGCIAMFVDINTIEWPSLRDDVMNETPLARNLSHPHSGSVV